MLLVTPTSSPDNNLTVHAEYYVDSSVYIFLYENIYLYGSVAFDI